MKRCRSEKGSLNEVPFALLLLIILMAFPLIDLLGVVTGAAISCLIAHQAATRAASHQRYDGALSAMQGEANNLLQTGFANFARMTPVNGFSGTGADLYILVTNYRNSGTQSYGPNTPVQNAIDPSTCLYECNVRTKYEVGPTISMAGTPILGSIPGLGKPVTISFEASRAAEYPMGLNKIADLANQNSPKGPPLTSLSIPWDAAMNPAGSSWNFPGLYQAIFSNGLTPIDDDVLVVAANNPLWTPTRMSSLTKLYLDLRSDGSWSVGTLPGGGPNILSPDGVGAPMAGNGLPQGALIGKIGNGTPFLVGKSELGLSPPGGGSGILSLAMNAGNGPSDSMDQVDKGTADIYASSKGAQFVRIVSAK